MSFPVRGARQDTFHFDLLTLQNPASDCAAVARGIAGASGGGGDGAARLL